MLAPTPCIENNCPHHAVKAGRCQEHQRPAWYGSTRTSRLPKDWATRRLIVMRRDQGICHICRQPGADTIDHITQGDDHTLENLAPIHDRVAPHCHRYKSSKEGNEAKAANKTKRRH